VEAHADQKKISGSTEGMHKKKYGFTFSSGVQR